MESQRTESRGSNIEEEAAKNRLPTCLRCESSRHCASASSQEIPTMLKALYSTESRRNICDAGVADYSSEQYSTELWIKAL